MTLMLNELWRNQEMNKKKCKNVQYNEGKNETRIEKRAKISVDSCRTPTNASCVWIIHGGCLFLLLFFCWMSEYVCSTSINVVELNQSNGSLMMRYHNSEWWMTRTFSSFVLFFFPSFPFFFFFFLSFRFLFVLFLFCFDFFFDF